jgi:hypothetical protein
MSNSETSETSGSHSLSFLDNKEQDKNENLIKDSDTDYRLEYLANPKKVIIDVEQKIDEESVNLINISQTENKNQQSDEKSIHSEDSDENSYHSEENSEQSEDSDNDDDDEKLNTEKVDIKKPLTEQEIRMKKIDLLRKLCDIKASGYNLSKEYNFNSDLSEMEYEYELLSKLKAKQTGVGLAKSIFTNAITGIEFLNDRYDPFGLNLSGFSEHTQLNIDDYNDVMEELYEKYKDMGNKWGPEIRLVLMVVASATGFHMSKQMFGKNVDVMGMNPASMATKMFNQTKEKSNFMTPQEINAQKIMEDKLKQDKIKRQQQVELLRRQQKINQSNQSYNESRPFDVTPNTFTPNINLQNLQPEIKRPSNLEDIINKVRNEKLRQSERVISESSLESSSLRTSKTNKSSRKKATIKIDT